MIPFLPSQNPNLAALAAAGAMGPRVGGTEAGGNFAPVFGGALAGQLVAGLPASSLINGEGGLDPAAWAQLAEAVRVLTQTGGVSPATLEQMRGVMLVNIELLRQGAGETQALQNASFPAIQPVAPVGVVGVPVSDALIPAPAVPNSDQMEEPREISGRRRDAVTGAEVAMAAASAGMPVAMARQDLNVEQALAALERIVAQAPAAELVSLASALRQAIPAPVPMANPVMPGSADGSTIRNGIRTVPVSPSTPGMADASAASATNGGETSPVPRVGAVQSAPAEPAGNPAPAIVKPSIDPALPARQGGEAPSASANVSALPQTAAPVSGLAVEAVAVVTTAPAILAPVVATGETAPAQAAFASAMAAEPAQEVNAVPMAVAAVDMPEPLSVAPMFVPADGFADVDLPAFAGARPDAGIETEAAAVPSGEAAPMAAEPADEPVAWLARQAETGRADVPPALSSAVSSVKGEEPVRPVAIAMEAALESAPAIIPAVAAEPRLMEASSPVSIPAAANQPVDDGPAMPAISITTLEVEQEAGISVRQDAKAPVVGVKAPAPAPVLPASTTPAPALVGQPARGNVPANSTSPTPANAAVEPRGSKPAVVTPSVVVATGTAFPEPVQTAPAPAMVPAVSARVAGDELPETASTVMPAPETDNQAGRVDTASRNSGRAEAGMRRADAAQTPSPVVAGGVDTENPAGTAETGARRGARPALETSANPANANADMALAAARGQARETAALPVAVQAVLARVVDAVAAAKPGTVRELDLRINSPELGKVRVKFEVGEEGLVRVVIKTSTEQAATAIRDGLPQFRNTVESRNVSVQVTQVAVGTAADFGGGNNPQARQAWPNSIQLQASAVNRDEPEFVVRAPEGYLRRRALVDILA